MNRVRSVLAAVAIAGTTVACSPSLEQQMAMCELRFADTHHGDDRFFLEEDYVKECMQAAGWHYKAESNTCLGAMWSQCYERTIWALLR